jgi:hypothetical protein
MIARIRARTAEEDAMDLAYQVPDHGDADEPSGAQPALPGGA